eukprot:3941917-Rhodomonas_salina.2
MQIRAHLYWDGDADTRTSVLGWVADTARQLLVSLGTMRLGPASTRTASKTCRPAYAISLLHTARVAHAISVLHTARVAYALSTAHRPPNSISVPYNALRLWHTLSQYRTPHTAHQTPSQYHTSHTIRYLSTAHVGLSP